MTRMPPRVYVTNLPSDRYLDDVIALFRAAGTVKSVVYPLNLLTGRASAAIIEFADEQSATYAANTLDEYKIDGQALVVKRQREYAPPSLSQTFSGDPYQRIYEDELITTANTQRNAAGILDLTSQVNESLIQHLSKHPELMRSTAISSRKFEEIVAELWQGFGYLVELTKRTRDGGYDVLAIRSHHVDEQFLIECKRPTTERTLGISVIRELYGIVNDREATKGILATTNFLSRDAILFVQQHKWVLEAKDYHGIQEWIRQYLATRT